MNTDIKWSATSNPHTLAKGEELVDVAGIWGTGVRIIITHPYKHVIGPIQTVLGNPETSNSAKITS